LGDYVCTTYKESSNFTTVTNLSFQPPSVTIHCLTMDSEQLLSNLSFIEPQSYNQAVLHPGRQATMNKELQALEDTKTWEIVPLP